MLSCYTVTTHPLESGLPKWCGLISTKTSLSSAVVEPGVNWMTSLHFPQLLTTFSQKFQRKLI